MLRDKLSDALKEAMKARDRRRVATVRLILAAIKDREIAGRTSGDGESVGDDDVLQILAKMVRQRRESIEAYEQAGRIELAEQERAEIGIVESFMPQQLSAAEIADICKAVVDETGASGLKDIGRVMGALKARYAGQMDFGKASATVKQLLAG